MVCSKCGGKTRWDDIQHDTSMNESYRHRVCDNCGNEMNTCEIEVDANKQFMQHFYKCKNSRRKARR